MAADRPVPVAEPDVLTGPAVPVGTGGRWPGRASVARGELRPGCSVLDVASGLGTVARLAAAAAGPAGRVVASDISAAMLTAAAARSAPSGWAPIEYLQCPVSAITAAEMRRVTRPGGTIVLSTWAAEHPLGLFGPVNQVLREAGMAEPYPRAFDSDTYRLGVAGLRDLLQAAGWHDVRVQTVGLDASWPDAETATAALLGTPFGPLVSALPAGTQQQLRARLARELGATDRGVTIRTASNIARATR